MFAAVDLTLISLNEKIDKAMVWGAVVGMAGAQVLGMILYSKLILGKPWLRATFPGKSWEQISEIQRNTFHSEFIICLISQLILVLAMQYVVGPYLGIKSIEMSVKVAAGLTLLSALVDIPHCVFSQRAFVAFLIDHFYNFLVFTAASVALVYLG